MNARQFRIAQYNIAHARAEPDDPVMSGFTKALSRINELADFSTGFVWRLKTDKGDTLDIRPYENRLVLVTMSVWDSVDDLRTFVYCGAHMDFLRRRDTWFENTNERHLVLWWIPYDHIPDVNEGRERLTYLRMHGNSAYAFTFTQLHEPPECTFGAKVEPFPI